MGKIVSLDPNFSPKVWPDVEEARRVLRQAFRSVGYTKFSLDDASRLLGSAASPEETIQRIHELGPAVVVLTLGKDGSMVSRDGTILERLPARPIQVVDATGAGDSFWAGFLVALVEGLPLEKCLRFAREVVEIKLQTLGPLPAGLSKEQLLQKIMP
jgi:fructokinase